MYFNKIFSLALLASSANAFTPQTQSNVLKQNSATLPGKKQGLAPSNMPKTQLSMSDNTGDDFKEQLNKLQNEVDKNTQFLYLDVNRARNDLAKNWGWIVASGVATMGLGAVAFTLPRIATGVAYDGTVLTLAATGIISLFSVFAAENGHKLKSGLSGLGYSALAYYMGTHPFESLNIITLTIATTIAAEGLYEFALAAKNENLQGRGWHFASGAISTLAGLWLSASLPAASLITPGAALGARLTSNGATKVAVGLTGKEIADSQRKQ